jgi:hypothetical protein
MRWRGIDSTRWRGIDSMRWRGIDRLRWIGMNYIDICVGCIIGAVASIAFFRCCSLYRTIYKPRRRRFHPHYAFCRSWRAVRCASLFAPLIYTLSRSPATPTVQRVSKHITLRRRVHTLHTLATVAVWHLRSVNAAHAAPTQPSVRHAIFFPDERFRR